jgi:hypothetical protein
MKIERVVIIKSSSSSSYKSISLVTSPVSTIVVVRGRIRTAVISLTIITHPHHDVVHIIHDVVHIIHGVVHIVSVNPHHGVVHIIIISHRVAISHHIVVIICHRHIVLMYGCRQVGYPSPNTSPHAPPTTK